jgi:hypothetical protein
MNITKTFDGSTIEINDERILVTEGDASLDLWFEHITDGLVPDARWRVGGMVQSGVCSAWEAERLVFCVELARRELVKAAN